METYIEKKHVEENYILNKKQNETKKNFENWEKNQQNNFSRGVIRARQVLDSRLLRL